MKQNDLLDVSGFFLQICSKLKKLTQDKAKVNYDLEHREHTRGTVNQQSSIHTKQSMTTNSPMNSITL
jgi:hypothetical protein